MNLYILRYTATRVSVTESAQEMFEADDDQSASGMVSQFTSSANGVVSSVRLFKVGTPVGVQ